MRKKNFRKFSRILVNKERKKNYKTKMTKFLSYTKKMRIHSVHNRVVSAPFTHLH